MIAVLCAQSRSVYKRLPGCEVFDMERDARTYVGRQPVVAHPPCRLWSRLHAFAKCANPEGERDLGRFCFNVVLNNGGVLEQPANSSLFADAGVGGPGYVTPEGFVTCVDQRWFGHRAQKRTWLWISGLHPKELPELPFCLSGGETPVEMLGRAARDATPLVFATWLLEVARRAGGGGN